MTNRPPYYDEKRDLVMNHTYTCDSKPCLVSGYAMDVACVTLLKTPNEHCYTEWSTIQTAIKNSGDISRGKLWSTDQRCGCGADPITHRWGQYLCEDCLLDFRQAVQPVCA